MRLTRKRFLRDVSLTVAGAAIATEAAPSTGHAKRGTRVQHGLNGDHYHVDMDGCRYEELAT